MKTQAFFSPMSQVYLLDMSNSFSSKGHNFGRTKYQFKKQKQSNLKLMQKKVSNNKSSFEELLKKELLAHKVSKTEIKNSNIQSLHEYWA